jgi:predicted ArsR family transcriptional regulator
MHDAHEDRGGSPARGGGPEPETAGGRTARDAVPAPDAAPDPAPDPVDAGPAGRRLDVLNVLRDAAEPLEIARIAERLAVHPNTVRFHLDRLVRDGLAEPAEHAPAARRGTGRPATPFRAVRRMPRSGARRYRMLAEILTRGIAAGPDPSAQAVRAGRAWGRELAARGSGPAGDDDGRPEADDAVGRLVDLLAALGFAPERGTAAGSGADRLGLRNCPFLELAESGGEVVCPVHLGVMQGAMAGWDAPVTVDRLERFAEPDLCVAHLAPAEGAR